MKVKRTPWPTGFPDVIVHTTVKARDAHSMYQAAKSGDAEGAIILAHDLLAKHAIATLRALIGNQDVLLLPVIADEALGYNAIPDALAQALARELHAPVISGEIIQTNKVGHTRAPSFQRLVTPASFDGNVEPKSLYLLVDDHIGLGGTLASLRGHIESRGAVVLGITTLTESRDARQIALSQQTLTLLWQRHGEQIDTFWRGQFGYGIDCLTEVEAQNLCRQPSVAAIEDFLAQAAVEARGRGFEPIL
jgi:hypothetical protein